MYELTNLSIRPASDVYKTLPHNFQLICNNATHIEEISLAFNYQQFTNNFTHLNQINNLPLNSIIGKFLKQILRRYFLS